MTATQELVVPRSMPITLFAMTFSSSWQAVSEALVARRPLPRVSGEQASVFVELRPRALPSIEPVPLRFPGLYRGILVAIKLPCPRIGRNHGERTGPSSGRAFDQDAQRALVEALRICIAAAPLFTPVMLRKTGRPFSVRMTNLGPLGWVSDRSRLSLQAAHPRPAGPGRPIRLLLALGARLAVHHRRDPEAACQPITAPGPAWACTATGRGRLLLRPSCRSRWATPPCSASAARPRRPHRLDQAQDRRRRGLGGEARLSYHGVDRICPLRLRASCQRAAGSTLRFGA